MKKLTTQQFIERSKFIHGDKYDYSKVNYVNSSEKVCIICPKHGEFWKTPENHLHKRYPQGCPLCEKESKKYYNQSTTEDFIEKSKFIHGDKYDYSKVKYVNNHTKVCIICPIHGEFWQLPSSHLYNRGCPKCKGSRISSALSSSREEFIVKARKVHGDKYDYSKVEYKNNRTKVCIICRKHGEFWQTPDNHLHGNGCLECKKEIISKLKLTKWGVLLPKMKNAQGDKYIYDESTYVDTHHKIRIICPTHGEFWQTPNSHIRGRGCPKCNGGIKYTCEEFIEKAKKIHGDKYDYSKVDYTNSDTKVCIICPTHGEFWQTPHSHLNGNGCPTCNESHLERKISKFIKEVGIEYKRGKHFDWLGRQHLDFYLPKYNIAIECQGNQHFGLGGWAKGKRFEKIKHLDVRKKQLCEENGVKLYYFSYEKFDEFLGEKVYHDFGEMIEEIKK